MRSCKYAIKIIIEPTYPIKFVVFRNDVDEKLSNVRGILRIALLSYTNFLRTLNF